MLHHLALQEQPGNVAPEAFSQEREQVSASWQKWLMKLNKKTGCAIIARKVCVSQERGMKVTLPEFERAGVLVVGDVMLDRYWYGPTSRISPEAPVPVVKVENIENVLAARQTWR